MAHQPVLLQEVIKHLAIEPGQIVVDATVNGGGHARLLCDRLGKNGLLIGLDADKTALERAAQVLVGAPSRVILLNGNFRDLKVLLAGQGINEIDQILFDLGMNSDQLEKSGRGFSFQRNEPLLMTFAADPAPEHLTAAEIINTWGEKSLAEILEKFGNERFAKQIAKGVIALRKKEKILTTDQLVNAIKQNVPHWYCQNRLHCATKTFQALRIAVNDELNALQEGLTQGWHLLKTGGRLAVITFHSLEARVVKEFFKQSGGQILTKHVIKPAREEIIKNPRSRSAQLRIISKQKQK